MVPVLYSGKKIAYNVLNGALVSIHKQIILFLVMHHKQLQALTRFIPAEAAQHVAFLISNYRIQLRITRKRVSKLGDFRPSVNGSFHKISVNGNLNIYAFLLVFLHELAHLQVWLKYKNQVSPHGDQWKAFFGELIRQFVARGYFHPRLKPALIGFCQNIKASGLGDAKLARELSFFDQQDDDDGKVFLEELPQNSIFVASNGRRFRKEERLRKRFRCFCLDNDKRYLFSPMARVEKSTDVNS